MRGKLPGFAGVVLLGLMSSVQAAPSADYEDLKKKLGEVKFYKVLLAARAKIDSDLPGRCGKWIKEARKYRKALEALDIQYRGRYDRNYQKEFRDQKELHRIADERYRKCFARNLFESRILGGQEFDEFEWVKSRKISSDAVFKTVQDGYDEDFKGIDLDARIRQLEIDVAVASGANYGPFARIIAVRGKAIVFHRGRGKRVSTARAGMALGESDTIQTHKDGRVEIEFSGASVNVEGKSKGAGRARVHIGGSTKVRLDHYDSAIGQEKPAQGILTDIVYGSLRAITDNLELRSRARGGGIGGIRGTEASFSYDPSRKIFEASLAHGDAYVMSGGREVTLRPATTVAIQDGRLGAARPLSRAKWNRIVTGTGMGKQDRKSAAKFGTGPRPKAVAQVRTRTRPQARANIGSGRDGQFQTSMRGYARSVTATVLSALRANDAKALLANTGGVLNAAYRNKLKTQSLKSLMDRTRARPVSYAFRCTACNPAAGTCQVLANIRQESDAAGRFIPTILDVGGTRRNPEFRVNKASRATPGRLKAFNALQPVCRGKR